MQNLVYDLSYGIRLPTPIYCPQSISKLLGNCFHVDPDKRPDFQAAKEIILLSFNELTCQTNAFPVSAERNAFNPNECAINKMEDSTMKLRYASILKRNDNNDKYNKISINNKSSLSCSSSHSANHCENESQDKHSILSQIGYTITRNENTISRSNEIVIDVHGECNKESHFEGISLCKWASLHDTTHFTHLEQRKKFHTFPRYVKGTF